MAERSSFSRHALNLSSADISSHNAYSPTPPRASVDCRRWMHSSRSLQTSIRIILQVSVERQHPATLPSLPLHRKMYNSIFSNLVVESLDRHVHRCRYWFPPSTRQNWPTIHSAPSQYMTTTAISNPSGSRTPQKLSHSSVFRSWVSISSSIKARHSRLLTLAIVAP